MIIWSTLRQLKKAEDQPYGKNIRTHKHMYIVNETKYSPTMINDEVIS